MRRTLVLALIAAASVACDSSGLSGNKSPGCLIDCTPIFPAYLPDFQIEPWSITLLKGDTIRLTLQHSQKFSSVGTWSILSDTVSFVNPDGRLSQRIDTAVATALITGRKAGTAEIRAQSPDSAIGSQVPVRVADSSVIAHVRIFFSRSTTMKLGDVGEIGAQLLDVNQEYFRGLPTGWSNSDSSVVGMKPHTQSTNLDLTALKAGTAVVTARFLNVKETIVVTVVP